MLFAEFVLEMIDLPEATLRVRHDRHGPAVLLGRELDTPAGPVYGPCAAQLSTVSEI